jgi:ABC-type Fe3+ transport system substrate-binding protein
VPIPEAHNVVASYPIAVLKGAPNAAGARDVVAYMLSPSGQRVLAHSGFLPPCPPREGIPLAAAIVASLGPALFILALVGLLWKRPGPVSGTRSSSPRR